MNRGDGGSCSNFFPLSPPPSHLPPNFPTPRLPPLPSDLFNIPNVLRIDEFLNNNDFNFHFSNDYVPQAPDTPPLKGFAGNFFPNGPSTAKNSSNVVKNAAKTSSKIGTNTIQTMSGDRLIGKLERVIEKEKPKEEIVSDESIIFSLPIIPTTLDNEDFEIKQGIKKQKDDEINEELDLTRLKDEIGDGEIPKEIEFYFGGKNCNFFLMCSQLGLNKDNENFIDFLSSDIGLQIFRENMFSIYIETGNIFYDHYNTNESIYSFLLNQHDETKQIIHVTVIDKDCFSNYLKYFLDDVDNKTVKRFDLFAHKIF